jgi:TolB-like protein/DNA-binding winged helix-turn-helix (wHTH) protein
MNAARLRFGVFEFDPRSGELWREGRRVSLQRQPSRLLELLTARPGEIVSREEIRQALWGDDTHVDFERSLNFCVARLRSALRDNAASPAYIETVPTRGYRFIAAVDPSGAAPPDSFRLQAEATGTAAEATDAQQMASGFGERKHVASAFRRKSRRALLAASVAALLVAAGVGLWAWRPGAHSTPKVVVVPFRNETGVPDLDRVAKGVSDATVARLAESSSLRVIGNASGLTFSFRPGDMKAMGDALGAQYLVLGQMKRDEHQMRIVAHLIRVSDQTHVWATTIDRPSMDLPAQSEIADLIAKAVTARIRS